MRKLGIVVFSSHSGLGNQSRRLTQFLKPERILLVDNSTFSKNSEQHPDWYEGFTGLISNGFPSNPAVVQFLDGLTHLYIIENPLNWSLINVAKRHNIKTFIASNYEFCDNLNRPDLPIPDLFLMPSYWKVKEMQERFGTTRAKYLPPPVFPEEFTEVREINWNRKTARKKFLHVVGTLAAADRNGTLLLIGALKHTKEEFDIVIKSQQELPPEYKTDDRRVSYKFGSEPEVADIYKDFDAMIMPRRFGGLCLPMQEALMSGLPVIMSAISPNIEILPQEWLVRALHFGTIQTRSSIDLYATPATELAAKIDEFAKKDLENEKITAFEIAHREFAPSSLQEAYNQLW